MLNVLPDRWVPEGVDLEEVDALWRTLVESNPRYHDGECLQVLGVVRNGHAGATIHLAPTSYRFHAVRRLGMETGVRPLGVKGLSVVHDPVSGDPRLLAGRRSEESGTYPGRWEYLPGGGVEPDAAGRIDPVATIRTEIREEIGTREATIDPIALAILEDRAVGTWEIVLRVTLAPPTMHPPGWEHTSFALVTPDTLPTPASDAALLMSGLADDVIRAARA